MSPTIDRLAIETQLSGLITRKNVDRLAGVLGGINPALGTIAGVMGAVIARAAENVNAFIDAQWNRPLLPPDVLIPMNYDLALRFLRSKGLADTFAKEIAEAETEADLWTRRQKQNLVCSIASVMDLVVEQRDRKSPAFGFFDRHLSEGNYREIWDHWEEYAKAREELNTMLPVSKIRSLLSIAFGNNPLNTVIQEVPRAEGAKGLRQMVGNFIKDKLGLEVDLESLIARIA